MNVHKLFVAICIVILFIACNNAANTAPPLSKEDSLLMALQKNPVYKEGVELVAKSDCLTCHKVDEVILGPSYREVANRYENTPENIEMLTQKIIEGGKGNWGEVPMSAHPQLLPSEAKKMVQYILLLKNK
ncbi:MAG: c-type cytochrome [Chitinophagaceae bacterium]